MSKPLIALVRKKLAEFGVYVFRTRPTYAQDGLVTIHNDHFRRTPSFLAAYSRGVESSDGIDPAFEWRVHVALWAASASLRVQGDYVECGVNAGFVSSAIMHRLDWNSRSRRYFLVDTWAGPPIEQYDDAEIERGRHALAKAALAAGAYRLDLDRVRRNFSEWSSAVIVQGAVPDVLSKINASEIAFLHLDMNSALPERAALEYFWPRLSPGAMVLFDDYAYQGYEQQAVAIDSAVAELGASILSLPTGQGLIVK